MKKIIFTITACLFLTTLVPAQKLNNKEVEKEVQVLALELRKAWDARDNNAWMACFGEPEGLIISGGETLIPDTMRVRNQYYWTNRKDESWVNDKVLVIPLSETSALLQITYSGRFTWIPTGVTWEFKSSSFSTSLVKKTDGKWKIVAHHNSWAAKQVTK